MEDVCVEIDREIRDLTVDTTTGEILLPEDLTKDELAELVRLERRYSLHRCGCETAFGIGPVPRLLPRLPLPKPTPKPVPTTTPSIPIVVRGGGPIPSIVTKAGGRLPAVGPVFSGIGQLQAPRQTGRRTWEYGGLRFAKG